MNILILHYVTAWEWLFGFCLEIGNNEIITMSLDK